jgi:hypothetical protein
MTKQYISQYLFNIIRESVDVAGYLNNILVVPYDGSVDNFHVLVKKRTFSDDMELIVDPATVITRAF